MGRKEVPRKDKNKVNKAGNERDEASQTIQGAFKQKKKDKMKRGKEEVAPVEDDSPGSQKDKKMKQRNGKKDGGVGVEKPKASPEEGQKQSNERERDEAAQKFQVAYKANSVQGDKHKLK